MGQPKKYLAASVPRYLRVSRLNYLPLQSIIGCWYIQQKNDLNIVFDIIMLPEDQFKRAQAYLGVPDAATPTLSRGGNTVSYITKDNKEITVPEGEPNPDQYAKDYFLTQFQTGLVNPKENPT